MLYIGQVQRNYSYSLLGVFIILGDHNSGSKQRRPPVVFFLQYGSNTIKYFSFVYFCFYFQYSGRWVIEDPAVMYVRECFAYVLL